MKKLFLAFGIGCLALISLIGLYASRAWLSRPASDAPGIEVRIAQGWSTTQIAFVLQDKGVIDSAFGYRVYSYLDAAGRRGKPGAYTLHRGESYHDIAKALDAGPIRQESDILIVEGWDLTDITKELRTVGVGAVSFDAAAWRDRYAFLRDLPKGATLEGYLFPDTYRVYVDQLPDVLIQKQLDAFAKRAPRLAAEAQKQGRTLQDVVTLASIVEKEVARPEDRKIVAGIFWNRLHLHMPLQSDATVNYVTHGDRTRPSFDDIAIDSPYNTYKVKGLPPGPISAPGDDALDAALFPAKTEYHFFLTDPQGNTYFAKTFEEHINNRAKAFGK